MKQVNLTRYYKDDKVTLGVLTIEGIPDPIFYTVERPWLNNEPNISCIPQGTYQCKIHQSPKNGEVYEVQDVSGRTYIQFHIANTADEVQGCIGVGNAAGYVGDKKGVRDSVLGFASFKHVMEKEPFQLTIRG